MCLGEGWCGRQGTTNGVWAGKAAWVGRWTAFWECVLAGRHLAFLKAAPIRVTSAASSGRGSRPHRLASSSQALALAARGPFELLAYTSSCSARMSLTEGGASALAASGGGEARWVPTPTAR